jgi:glycerol transport system ATP-binding protein
MTLQLKNAGKTVDGVVHIHPTNIELESGTFNTLLGTTLAGKTTLMQLMAGLEPLSSGSIWFNGKDVTGIPVQKRNVSMVYQQFVNYPMMNVFENIASPLKVARVSANDIKKRVGDIAELLQISAMLNRKPSELSGGQQQRCAMARAMVKDSDLILLDEPLANLDFKLREELRDELPRIFAKRDCVVVYATTEPTEALLLGGQTAAMHQGRVVQFGPTSTIYETPNTLESALVFSEPPINVADVTKAGGRFHLDSAVSWAVDKKTKTLADGEYTFAIRPHHVTPVRQHRNDVPIDGVVEVAELSGSESVVHFEAYNRAWVSQSHGIHAYDAGEKTQLFADVSKAFFFDQNGRLAAG